MGHSKRLGKGSSRNASLSLHWGLEWGWKWSGRGLRKTAVPDLRERRTATLVLELWLEGKTQREIVAELERLHIRNRGYFDWSVGALHRLIKAGHKLNQERLNLAPWEEMVLKQVKVEKVTRLPEINFSEQGKPVVVQVERHAWALPTQELLLAGREPDREARIIETGAGFFRVSAVGWLYQGPVVDRRKFGPKEEADEPGEQAGPETQSTVPTE